MLNVIVCFKIKNAQLFQSNVYNQFEFKASVVSQLSQIS